MVDQGAEVVHGLLKSSEVLAFFPDFVDGFVESLDFDYQRLVLEELFGLVEFADIVQLFELFLGGLDLPFDFVFHPVEILFGIIQFYVNFVRD